MSGLFDIIGKIVLKIFSKLKKNINDEGEI